MHCPKASLTQGARRMVVALACATVTLAQATPSAPLPCDGVFGTGGCAPYTQIQYLVGAPSLTNLFEYQPVPLDVTASNAFGAVRGQADMRSGEMKVYGRSSDDGNPSTGNHVTVAVGISDVFTLHGPGPLPSRVQFQIVLEADGVGTIDLDGHSAGVLLSFGGPSLGLVAGSVPFAQRTFQAGLDGLPVAHAFPIHLSAFADALMPPDAPFELDTLLRADVSEGSTLDLSHTARLHFVLPDGVSITSMGGYTGVSPVPEPGTWALFAAGLLITMRLARHRRR